MPVLTLNGEPRDFPAETFPQTLAELVRRLGVDEVAVVAEVDGAVAARGAFAQVRLVPGAKVELVRFVGGG